MLLLLLRVLLSCRTVDCRVCAATPFLDSPLVSAALWAEVRPRVVVVALEAEAEEARPSPSRGSLPTSHRSTHQPAGCITSSLCPHCICSASLLGGLMRGVRCSAPLSSDLHPGGAGLRGAFVSPNEGLRGERFLFIGRPRAEHRASVSGERGRGERADGRSCTEVEYHSRLSLSY